VYIYTDKHFNVFYSYAQGKKGTENNNILENNITRALLITMKESKKARNTILNTFEPNFPLNDDIYFNFQSVKEMEDKEKITNWTILIISPEKYDEAITTISADILKYYKFFDNNKDEQNDSEKIIREINQRITNETDVCRKRALEDCKDYILRNGLPDGWIINTVNKAGICIESKIEGTATKRQIDRHKKYIKENFKNVDISTINVVSITWNAIYEVITKGISQDDYLVKNFKEYLIMSGLVLNFDFTETGKWDDIDLAKEQFKLLLEKIDQKVKIENFGRSARPLDLLWDLYGTINGDKVKMDPHYSVSFNPESTSIALTTKGTSKIRSLVAGNLMLEYLINSFNDPHKHNYMYYLQMSDYKIIDHKKGQMKGETYMPFDFYISLSSFKNENQIREMIDTVQKLIPFAKLVRFGVKIDFPNNEKIKENTDDFQMRKENKKFISDPQKVVDLYSCFIKETFEIFKSIEN